MALRKFVERITKPIEDQDREALAAFCHDLGTTPIAEVQPRTPLRVAGEIRAVRIVPRAGAPALEVTVSDGEQNLTAVFLGRRKIAGMTPGRRLVLEGVASGRTRALVVYNPIYTLVR